MLGNSFKGVSLNNYNKTLQKIEDKEDYETGKQTLKAAQDQIVVDEEQPEGEEPAEEGGEVYDQIVDVERIISVLPPIYIYGLKLIENYSGGFENLKEDDPTDEDLHSDKESKMSEETADGRDSNLPMHPPRPLERTTALSIMKDEKVRFSKYYGFAQPASNQS